MSAAHAGLSCGPATVAPKNVILLYPVLLLGEDLTLENSLRITTSGKATTLVNAASLVPSGRGLSHSQSPFNID